jgi:hypothetical protein
MTVRGSIDGSSLDDCWSSDLVVGNLTIDRAALLYCYVLSPVLLSLHQLSPGWANSTLSMYITVDCHNR